MRRHGVVFHEEFAQLRAFGYEEMDRLAEFAGGEVEGADQLVGAGGHVELVVFLEHGQCVKLPGLPLVEVAEAIDVDLLLAEVHGAGQADVLLDPGIFDGLGVDPIEPLGQVAEGAADGLLHLENVLHLSGGEHALFDQ